jgi:ATP-dependent Lon protease
MFIATSNTMSSIQPALRDRMEIIKMSGYTIEEKVEIARQHLLQDNLKNMA